MIIYLVQGQAKLVSGYMHLSKRKDCDAFFLTYDEPLDGATFFPNSTWAEGRNRLLELALEYHSDFEYIVYADDDLEFYHGDWDTFEAGLRMFQPKVAVPVFDRTVSAVLSYPLFRVQNFTFNDEQLMAFRKDVVMERKVLPYDTRFDSLHWWATCRLQQILLQHFYKDGLLQFNFVRISNLEHDRYTFENNDEGVYQDEVLSWLNLSLKSPVEDICKQPSKLALLFGTLRNLAKLGLLWRPGVFGSLAQTWRKSWTLSKSIETKQLPNLLKEGNEWVIYGYGEVGQKLMQSLVQEEKDSAIKKVVDRQAKKSPFEVDGVSVESPDSIEYSSNVRVIVASFSFVKQIEFYLKYGLGLDSHQILLLRES